MRFLTGADLKMNVEEQMNLYDPFLKAHRVDMELPRTVKEWLYWNGVDRVLDLVQMTDDEMRAITIGNEAFYYQVMDLMSKHGHTLLSGSKITYKISSNSSILSERPVRLKRWTIRPAGAAHIFDIDRPTLYPEWFDEYYKRYERKDDTEERILRKLVPVKAGIHNEEVGEFGEFFNSARDLWEDYHQTCTRYGITPLLQNQRIPEDGRDMDNMSLDRFIAIKKDVLRALISAFDELGIYSNSSMSDFFKATDEGKLNISELEKNEHIQSLMIRYVALRIDFDNVVWYVNMFFDLKNKPYRYWPLNPWMEILIMCYRHATDDEKLHSEYMDYLKSEPKKTWIDFLSEYALAEEIKEHIELIALIEDLLVPIEDYELSEKIESTLNAAGIERIGDLMQFTREEIEILFDYDKTAIEQIEYCLNKEGYCLWKSEQFTYKIPMPLNLI